MRRNSLVSGLIGLAVVTLCAAAAVGVVVGVRWLLDRLWPDFGPHPQLVFALVAPFGVVLFALLVAKVGRIAGLYGPDAVHRIQGGPTGCA